MVQNDHDIIQPITAPHPFVRTNSGYSYRLIISGFCWIVAPTIARTDRGYWQVSSWTGSSISPIIPAFHTPDTDGSPAIAFTFFARDAAFANGAWDESPAKSGNPSSVND